MDIGEMNRRVTIQSRQLTQDSGGGHARDWVNVATVWASVRPSSASELLLGMQSQQETTHTVGMRFRALDKTQRLIYKGRVLNIQTVENVKEESRFLKIKCVEV